MSSRFTGRVALVTGGGSGIGRATALALAAEGATVVVAGRNSAVLAETADAGPPGSISGHIADVTDDAQVATLIADIVAEHGGLHIAVNNAGMVRAGTVVELSEADWAEQVALNMTAVFLCLKHEVAQMRAAGGGAIVNVSSNIGMHRRVPGMTAYAATKAAVSVLTRGAALDHIREGVRINAVSPGAMDTRLSFRPGESEPDRAARLQATNPSGRVGALDEVTSAILWLCSDAASYAVGTDLVIDGGAST